MKKIQVALFIIPLLLIANSDLLAHSPHDVIRTVAVSPNFPSDSRVFCSLMHIDYFLLRSDDAGLSWYPSQLGLPYVSITCIVISEDYASDGIMFVGTRGEGVFTSSDGGTSWSPCNSGITNLHITTLSISPSFAKDQTIFTGTEGGGVFKSSDGGTSWSPCNSGLSNLDVASLSISPSFDDDQIIFIGTRGRGVFKSANGGLLWASCNSGLLNLDVTMVFVSSSFTQDQTVFATTWGDGVWRTLNGGQSWENKSEGITDLFATALVLSPNYHKDQTLLVATKDEGAFRSTDGGASWIPASEGLDEKTKQTSIHYLGFSISPNYENDQTIFFATFEGLHRSKNGGGKWNHLNVYHQKFIRTIVASPDYADDGTAYAGSYGGGVYGSAYIGTSWKALNTGLSHIFVAALAISSTFDLDETIFLSAFPNIFKSTNRGKYWKSLEVSQDDWVYIRSLAISPDYHNDQTLFAGNGRNGLFPLYKSLDGGDSFLPISANYAMSRCLAISPDYTNDQTLFVGTERGVFRSLHGGNLCECVGLEDQNIFALVVSPSYQTDRTVFAGTTEKGAFKSTDGGETWVPVNNGIGDMGIRGIGISPNYEADKTVFAATKSYGVFKSTNGGASWQYKGLRDNYVYPVAISPDYPIDQTIFVGAWDGVYSSTNGGDSWELVLTPHRHEEKSECIVYEGDWKYYEHFLASGANLAYSVAPTAKGSLYFLGDSVSWIGETGRKGGIANIYIDSTFEGTVDLYSQQRKWQQTLYSKTDLDDGLHTITIEVSGLKNPDSLGRAIFIDAFDVDYKK
ncbi:hypothetical protein [Desulfosporosinus sp.]|uniref:WD40/YVTN/BNR-like repeat-containing protein n=1 Tax=Desulfosporosinus sp. TaxID=157907 RepID=UPI0025BB08EE|nr:hypothetical protein [Desulfosporosinus sp.]MBC2726097.1 hypothetical protein [Desulfosporosinus sp.]